MSIQVTVLHAFGHPVATCWIKFENGQIFVATFLDVARVWPVPSQHDPTIFLDVALKFCLCLSGPFL